MGLLILEAQKCELIESGYSQKDEKIKWVKVKDLVLEAFLSSSLYYKTITNERDLKGCLRLREGGEYNL